jgi:hypothetical protein
VIAVREIGPTLDVEGADNGIAEGGEGLGSGARADMAAILAEAAIARVVSDIFNGPVPATDVSQLSK